MRELAQSNRLCANTLRGGFTLLEVLVAAAILAMILSIVFGTFFYTVSTAERVEEQTAMRHRAGFILEEISRSISSAFVPYAGLYEDVGDERPVFAGSDDPLADAQADSLGVFTANPRFGGGVPGADITYVRYEAVEAFEIDDAPEWVEDENNPLVLMCTVEPLFAIPDSEAGRLRFWMLNVRSIGLQYFDGDGWLDEWVYEEQGALPGAVKIEVELADSAGEGRTYSTIASVHVDMSLEDSLGAVEIEEEIEELEEEAEEPEEEAEEPDGEDPFAEAGEESDEGGW